MRVDVTPPRLSAIPGSPAVVTISVSNTGTVITGHRIRVLGVDPRWVHLDQQELSLFPDTTGVAVLAITLPRGIPAGARTVSVEITELTPPFEVEVVSVELTVPAELGLGLALDPVSVTAGKKASVGVIIENTGNSVTDVDLLGRDEEGQIGFIFQPPRPTLSPGEQAIATAHLRAKRPWFGSPKVRPFTVEVGPRQAPVIAFGAWVQKARLSRGAMALLGLGIAATVFAAVIFASLSQVVNRSTADRDLAIQVAEAANAGDANAGTSAISGTVLLLTRGTAVSGVSVQLFQASNTASPIVSTATGTNGGYHFTGLAAGQYKLQFQGAGFTDLWYPSSLTPANAGSVTLAAKQTVTGIDIRLGGLPGTVSGQVMGANLAGAVLTVEVPGAGGVTGGPAVGTPEGGGAAATGTGPSIVTTQTLDASGKFTLAGIPSPAVYELVVTKQGYAPAVQQIDLGGGEDRGGITLSLQLGNGSIRGTVSTSAGPLGGATISASDGTTTVSTVSLTTAGNVGTFILNSLPTPDTLIVVVSANGYATQTLSLSLTSQEQLTGVAVTLVSGVGSISGTVSTTSGGPAGGVTVSATDGKVTVTAVTLSTGQVGTYTLSGLTVPGTYTVTFSRPDLASQTQSINLTATGNPNLTGVNATLISNTATVFGTVTQTGGLALDEVTVTLSSGSTSYTVTSATSPKLGAYEIDGVQPGTYTISFTRQGGQPTSSIVALAAGQRLQFNPVLNPAASIFGHVVEAANTTQPVPSVLVTLYLATQFPTVAVTSTLTNVNGDFTFNNVEAPQSFVVSFAFPQTGAPQETVLVQTTLGTASPVCGHQATGGSTAATSTTVAGATCNPATDPIVVSTS